MAVSGATIQISQKDMYLPGTKHRSVKVRAPSPSPTLLAPFWLARPRLPTDTHTSSRVAPRARARAPQVTGTQSQVQVASSIILSRLGVA